MERHSFPLFLRTQPMTLCCSIPSRLNRHWTTSPSRCPTLSSRWLLSFVGFSSSATTAGSSRSLSLFPCIWSAIKSWHIYMESMCQIWISLIMPLLITSQWSPAFSPCFLTTVSASVLTLLKSNFNTASILNQLKCKPGSTILLLGTLWWPPTMEYDYWPQSDVHAETETALLWLFPVFFPRILHL